MKKKCILIVLDGAGDRACAELDSRTPLQAAHTPHCDRLARLGSNGLYHAAVPGQALPSEYAHFALFGYDLPDFPGRGILEALGAGVPLAEDDVAVLGRIVSVRETNGLLMVEHQEQPASEQEAAALTDAVARYSAPGAQIGFYRTVGVSGIVTISGGVAPFITDSDPLQAGRFLTDIRPWSAFASDDGACTAAQSLKAYLLWAYHELCRHPVNRRRARNRQLPLNALATNRAGRRRPVVAFAKRYGLRGLSIASGNVYKGLSAYLGLDFQQDPDSRDPGRDLARRMDAAMQALRQYDFVHVHTKAPDAAAHSRQPLAKKAVIEALDRGLGRSVEQLVQRPEVLTVLTSDHSTPSSGALIHSGEPVAVTFCGCGARRDQVQHFDEISAAGGALGLLRGRELLYMVLNCLDRAKLLGLMDTPDDQPFWPGGDNFLRVS